MTNVNCMNCELVNKLAFLKAGRLVSPDVYLWKRVDRSWITSLFKTGWPGSWPCFKADWIDCYYSNRASLFQSWLDHAKDAWTILKLSDGIKTVQICNQSVTCVCMWPKNHPVLNLTGDKLSPSLLAFKSYPVSSGSSARAVPFHY